jgi:hypothetical protein
LAKTLIKEKRLFFYPYGFHTNAASGRGGQSNQREKLLFTVFQERLGAAKRTNGGALRMQGLVFGENELYLFSQKA